MTTSITTARQRKLASLHDALEEYRALVILSGQYNAAVKRERELALAALNTLTRHELDAGLSQVKSAVLELRKTLGARYPGSAYVQLVRDLESNRGELNFIPKWVLKGFFRNIEDFMQLGSLPEHTRISIDGSGTQPVTKTREVRITEAALFEDMCAMFNWARTLTPRCRATTATKPDIKASAAARRGAVVAAFYLVEAYLNSLAFDHVVNHRKELSVPDLEKLTEWDYTKDRERFVSFRDKLLGYPRIIKGAQSPLLQENNCPEIAFLLGQAKNYRDAIVDANPKSDLKARNLDKELTFWIIGSCTPIFRTIDDNTNGERGTNLWIQTVDNAIEVVVKIETAVNGDTSRLFWLRKRPAGEPFPDIVFE